MNLIEGEVPCPRCQQPNPSANPFCGHCGAPIKNVQLKGAGKPPRPLPAPRSHAYLASQQKRQAYSEVCDIRLHRRYSWLMPLRQICAFEAVALGPSGQYSLYESPKFSWNPWFSMRNFRDSRQYHEALDGLVTRLLQDGWEPAEGMIGVTSFGRDNLPRFKRLVSPPEPDAE